jgi:4-hydroxyacetophenone monooxygenase
MQIVPAIVDRVAHLTVFQRSPQWIAPNRDVFRRVDPDQHWLMDVVPFYRRWYRARLAWTFNDKVHRSLQLDPAWDTEGRSINAENDGHRRAFTRYLLGELEGRPDLVDKCLPRYPPFGKRMLLDNGWFAALRRDHVDLVTEPVESFTPSGVRSRSDAVDADVVILCTGFEAHGFLSPMRVTGRSGIPLAQQWGTDDATAYLGVTVPDFPNLFLLIGPNTALGHGGSMITIAELQVGYVAALVERLVRHRIGAVEVRREVADEYNRRVDAAHARMIWTHPAMTNWYRNAAGRVVNTLPWRIVDYRAMVREPDPADFVETPLREDLRPSA